MGEFIWKKSFNIGVVEVDKQHKELLELLNKCIDEAKIIKQKAIFDEKIFSDVQNLINELVKYTDYHFKTEEKLMRSVNYPDLEHHLSIHHMLTEQVIQLKNRIDKKDKGAINSIIDLLRNWYMQHIMDEDKRIGAHVLSIKK